LGKEGCSPEINFPGQHDERGQIANGHLPFYPLRPFAQHWNIKPNFLLMNNHVTSVHSRYLLFGPVLIALLVYLWSNQQYDLTKKEAREGVPIVNMFQGESIWLPKINDDRYRTKPPMFYWSGLLISKMQGKVNEFSIRLPSVLTGAGAVFLTTLLGFWLYSPVTGAFAGLITATNLQFSFLSTTARIDMLFTFFILLAWTALGFGGMNRWKFLSINLQDPSFKLISK
jgi:4-amino-4-deoxy-L-arabinose transferase-like glycosyltransferase